MRDSTKPWLIQCCTENKHPFNKAKGLDRILSYDYMGSSEFEFGALGTALKAMRRQTLTLQTLSSQRDPKWKLFILSEKDQYAQVKDWVMAEIAGTWRGKERADLKVVISPSDFEKSMSYQPRTTCWWRVDEGHSSWMVFRSKALALKVQAELSH